MRVHFLRWNALAICICLMFSIHTCTHELMRSTELMRHSTVWLQGLSRIKKFVALSFYKSENLIIVKLDFKFSFWLCYHPITFFFLLVLQFAVICKSECSLCSSYITGGLLLHCSELKGMWGPADKSIQFTDKNAIREPDSLFQQVIWLFCTITCTGLICNGRLPFAQF